MTGAVPNPGALHRRLVLEAPVESADGAGSVTRSCQTVATLWASIVPATAREGVTAASLGANVTHRIQIRYSADITLRHRFRDGEAVYRFVALRERGNRRFLDIDAELRID
jgi:SPP1 family predicted phage head-tail adaptor